MQEAARMPARSGLFRIAIIAIAAAALMLAITSASAPAKGSNWSTTKCNNTLAKWERQHQSASSKKLNGEVRHLEKKHGCVFVG
jgi:hypothetical protein